MEPYNIGSTPLVRLGLLPH